MSCLQTRNCPHDASGCSLLHSAMHKVTNPGHGWSNAPIVVSGATSCGAMPVPPVIRIRSIVGDSSTSLLFWSDYCLSFSWMELVSSGTIAFVVWLVKNSTVVQWLQCMMVDSQSYSWSRQIPCLMHARGSSITNGKNSKCKELNPSGRRSWGHLVHRQCLHPTCFE